MHRADSHYVETIFIKIFVECIVFAKLLFAKSPQPSKAHNTQKFTIAHSVKDVEVGNGNPDMTNRFIGNIVCQLSNMLCFVSVEIVDVGNRNPVMAIRSD